MTTHMTDPEFFLSILCHFEGFAIFFHFLAKLVEFTPLFLNPKFFQKKFCHQAMKVIKRKYIYSPFVLK